jgi:iron complex outermembrane receptor protein
MKKAFIMLSGLTTLCPLVAEEMQPDTLRNIQLEEVVISATRAKQTTPISFSDIPEDAIKKNNFGRDIPYIIALTPSVTVTSDAGTGIGYTAFRVRGTDVNRINITINGIPYNDPESHGAFFVDLPDIASSLSSMQIQRGVGTSTNGAAAFGASVNMQTENLNLEPYAEIGASGGSFNTIRTTVKAGSGLINDHFMVDGRYSVINSDGYIDRAWVDMQSYHLSAAYATDKTLIKLLTFAGKETTYQAWNGVDLDLVQREPLKYTRHYNDLGRYTDDDGNVQFYDNQTDNYTQTHYQLHLTQEFSPEFHLNAALHYTIGEGYYEDYKTDRKYTEYLLTPPIVDGVPLKKTDLIRQKWLDNDFYGATFALHYKKNSWDVVFGGAGSNFEGDHFGKIRWVRNPNNFDPEKDWYRNTSKKSDLNTYLKANVKIARNFLMYGDVQFRYIKYKMKGADDKYDEETGTMRDITQEHTFPFFNPKVGFTYQANDNHSVYASFSVANREPNRDNYTEAGPDEQPTDERLYDTEIGYRYQSPSFSFESNVYYMKYKDQLILTGKISEIGEMLTKNIPDSYRMGLELASAIRFNPLLRWDGNLTLSRNKIKNFTEEDIDVYDTDWNWIESRSTYLGSTDIAYSPNMVANSLLTFTYNRFEAVLHGHYVSRQYIDNTSCKDRSIDPYFVNNLRLAYTFALPHTKSVTAGLDINNLFNVEYETNGYNWYTYYLGDKRVNEKRYFPQAGTNILANLTVNF